MILIESRNDEYMGVSSWLPELFEEELDSRYRKRSWGLIVEVFSEKTGKKIVAW